MCSGVLYKYNLIFIGKNCDMTLQIGYKPYYNYQNKIKTDNKVMASAIYSVNYINKTDRIAFSAGKIAIPKNFDSVVGFLKLSEEQKEFLRKQFSAKVDTKPYLPHPFGREVDLDRIIDFAENISHEFNNYRMVSVGRSPVWFAEAIKNRKDIYLNDYTFVALSKSSGFIKKMPEKRQINAYRKYLSKINLTPQKIIEDMENGKKTAFFDFISSGESMQGFIKIFDEWTKELCQKNKEFKSKFKSEEEAINKLHKSIKIVGMYWEHNDIPSTPKGIKVSLHAVSNFLTNGFVCNKFNDDLVVEFPPSKWTSVSPTKKKPSYNAQLSRFMLIDRLHQRNLLNKEPQNSEASLKPTSLVSRIKSFFKII